MLIYKPAAWKVNHWTDMYRNNKYYKSITTIRRI